MKGLRSIPRILKINEIDGYLVSCLFNNGESRIIDFKELLEQKFKLQPNQVGYILTQDIEAFNKIKLLGTTIGWDDIGLESEDEYGTKVFYPYDLDPIVLYQNSYPDKKRDLIIGMMIRQARKEAGLTQEELAKKSGTTKHYISRLENNKSDIELLTLKKIVEAGLGKKLKVQIN